jgi:plasmid rolling circle replication initiator protein Rep
MPTCCKKNIPSYERNDKFIFLRDASSDKRDHDADSRKVWATKFAEALLAGGLQRPASRVRDCAEALFFAEAEDTSTGEIKLKLKSAPYCKYRHCPICQSRRSLKMKATLMNALPQILDDHPSSRFLFLTLTVQNCEVSHLRETIQGMNAGWKRFINRKDWPALGWIRAVEVTRGKDDSAHPHYHCLLMVPASYFGKGYVPTREWVKRWREAMRLDYDPICDIRVIKPKYEKKEERDLPQTPDLLLQQRLRAMYSAVAETAKYPMKSADLLSASPEWLAEYIRQVNALKFLTSGGALKDVLKDMREGKDEDLVNYAEGGDGAPPRKLVPFHFRNRLKAYARKRNSA